MRTPFVCALAAFVAIPLALAAQPSSPPAPQDPTPTPTPPPAPPTPAPEPTPGFGAALDAAAQAYADTGEFTFGATTTIWTSTPTSADPGVDPQVNAVAVLKFVHAHRFDPTQETTDQMVMDLVNSDPVVASQYASLVWNDSLTTDTTVDLNAALNHAALIQNYGVAGGATAQGTVISSGSPRGPILLNCFSDLGGIIYWPNEARGLKSCYITGCYPFEEAMVWLTVVQPNGTTYQRVTTSTPCGCAPNTWPFGANTQSGYAFASVPRGTATVLARTVYRCCQSGTASRTLSCPPGPRTYRPCVPIAPNAPLDIQMGPWTPPIIAGTVNNPGTLVEVILGTKESPCAKASWDYVESGESSFSIRSCLPATPWLYAHAGSLWAETPVPANIPCGSVFTTSLTLQAAPCFSGRVTPWQPSMAHHYFVKFEGCYGGGCYGGGMGTPTTGVNDDGTYNSGTILAPGNWHVSLWYVPNLQNPSYSVPASTPFDHRLSVDSDHCYLHDFVVR
jgi:hypothetical protein